jgi:hypothetical protein
MDNIDLAFTSFKRPFRNTLGQLIMGQLTEAGEKGTVGEFVFPRRFFRCTTNALAAPGTILMIPPNRKFLLMDNGDTSEGRFRTFKAIETNKTLTHKRLDQHIDPVTGLMRAESTPEDLPDVHCVFEPVKIEREIKSADIMKYRVLAGVELRVNDMIGSHKIESVEVMLGVYIAEAT